MRFIGQNEQKERLEYGQGHALAGIMAFALTIGLVAGGSLALCGIGGALLLYGLETARQRKWVPLQPLALGLGLAFLALVFLGNGTALAPERSWPMSLRLLSIVLPLMLFFRHETVMPPVPLWLPRFLPWAVLACLMLLLLEMLTGGGVLLPLLKGKHERLIYYNRGLSYAAVLIWPLVVLLLHENRRALALALLAMLLLAGLWSESRAAPLALLVGAGFFVGGRWLPRGAAAAAWGLLIFVFAVSLALAPWLLESHPDWLRSMPPSWRHRIEIWDYLLAWVWHHPWPPAGVDAAGIIPVKGAHQALYVYARTSAAHPHHMPLQLLLELGPAGWLWGSLAAGWALRVLMRWDGIMRAGALAGWAAFLTLTCGAFSLWSDSFWSLGALAAIFGQWLRNHCAAIQAA